jgi:hypothetical protein
MNYLYYHLFEGVCFGRRRRVAVLNRIGTEQILILFQYYFTCVMLL